jgi:hypothetical protein
VQGNFMKIKQRSCNCIGVFLLVLGVATEVAAGCSVSSPGLAFGAYQPLTFAGKLASTAVTSNATVTVACTDIVTGGAYSISMGPSLVGPGDRIGTRYMANVNGGDYMAFNVYLAPNYLTVWGDGMSGSIASGNIPPGSSNQTHVAYGYIPAGQHTLKGGSFSTQLTMMLTYNP